MVLAAADATNAKREAKRPHRRITVETSRPARPEPRPMRRRRASLPAPRSVHFSPSSEQCVFEPHPPDNWYTGRDHLRFRKERLRDVLAFRRSPDPRSGSNNGPRCPVGVEQLLSPEGAREALAAKKAVMRAILAEQCRQRAFGKSDPDLLARLSLKLSATAAVGAQKRGRFQEMARFVE